MRTFIFWLIIAALVGSGMWLLKHQGQVDKSLNALSKSFGGILGEKIAPKEEWEEILLGDWIFEKLIYNSSDVIKIRSELLYSNSNDNKLKGYLTYKRYNTEHSFNTDKPYIVGGGSIEGSWEITSNATWEERYSKCNIEITTGNEKGEDICEKYFPKTKPITYGSYNDDFSKSEILEFNKNSILIEHKYYSKDKSDTYHFTRP